MFGFGHGNLGLLAPEPAKTSLELAECRQGKVS
jgi:hypothetical protein